MTNVNISVCIPTKDRPADIARCLASIQRQDVAPSQIIIVDQSATKYELPAIPGLLHIYDPTIKGSAAARNRAWDTAENDIVFFLDDDIELLPNCLKALNEAIAANPDVVGFQCGIEASGQRLTFTQIHAMIFHRGFFNASMFKRGTGRDLRRLAGGATALRSVLRDHVRFDESLIGYAYGEDWEFSFRARKYGRFLLVPEARLIHHVSAVNRMKKEQLLRDRWNNFLYFYDKLNAREYIPNRFWRVWWMIGESIHWLRLGMGCPVLGIATKKAPKHGLTRQPDSVG